MNKRISTLFAASLLFSSVFGSSAWAENLEGAAGNGKYYKLLRSAQSAGTWQDLSATSDKMYLSLDKDGNLTMSSTINDIKDATWTVTKNADGTYTLVTASGHTLQKVDGLSAQSKFYSVDYKDNTSILPLGSEDNAFSIDYKGGAGNLQMEYVGPIGALAKAGWNLTASTGTIYDLLFSLEDVSEEVEDSDLNEFFNQKGFNLAVNYNADNGELAENIFGGDSRIWAFEIDNAAGYTISKGGANGKDLIIPQGMYFFTERVLKSGVDVVSSADDIDWLASSLIMVSPRETVEATVTDRAKGQGFKLVSLKGSEFLFQENRSEYKVADNPIENACFTVTDNQVGAYPFAISLKNFFYQANSKDKNTDKLTEAKDDAAVSLGVIAFTAEDTQYLTTIPQEANPIFKFSDSAAKDGKDLLKTTKEAAVYTIKFVAGNSEDEKLIGKYLTIAENGTSFKWVAKGSAITNTTYPSFQYTITDVEDEDLTDDVEKYTLITFTNRETNESFKARLFPETSYGENCYSLDITTGTVEVQPLKVVSNTYAVVNDGTAPSIDENVIIKLDPVAVNEYAGFYNVDNESVRTIRFARDKNDTSYKWYAGAIWDTEATPAAYRLKPSDITSGLFVEDVYEAAQFQLIKAEKPETIARTFVYNNTTTEDVDHVANGDKVSAYRYILRYINDGTPSEYFLDDNAGIELGKKLNAGDEFDAEEALKATNTDYKKFYIKENADGSVSLFGAIGAFESATTTTLGQRVTKPDKNTSVEVEMNAKKDGIVYVDGTNRSSIYESEFSDTDLRTYLEGEAPNNSWEGEGHVTLQNGTASVAGNYITVDDKNEGIVTTDASDVFYLHTTDVNAVVPSFYISKGTGEGSNDLSERLYMFNPADSVRYPINQKYDPNYQLAAKATKVIFKAGSLNATRDTMVVPELKGENKVIAAKSDNDGVWGGLNRFKFQIIETENGDGLYNIRQIAGSITREGNVPVLDNETVYLASSGQKLYFTKEKAYALALHIEGVEAPTANEGVSATDVKVIAVDGAINIKNAAGKNVVVSTILGQIVANEVLTSDNATISVPAGIAIVSVDGEEAVKVSVR